MDPMNKNEVWTDFKKGILNKESDFLTCEELNAL